MAKFYVTSGRVREVVVAQDAEGAALEALDRFFEPSGWVFASPELSDTDRRAHLALEALLTLDSRFRVSERGFDATECEHFETADLVDVYFRLAVAMNRFVQTFVQSEADELALA
jgi:hypothetical protein